MNTHGEFTFYDHRGNIIEKVPNIVPYEGASLVLDVFCRAVVPTFYVGLCNQIPTKLDLLSSITSEPTSAGGYARQALARNSTDWPTLDTVNNVPRCKSKTVPFAASGADFSAAFSRAFLCTVVSGTAGTLIAVSGALTTPLTILNGQTKYVSYELYNG